MHNKDTSADCVLFYFHRVQKNLKMGWTKHQVSGGRDGKETFEMYYTESASKEDDNYFYRV